MGLINKIKLFLNKEKIPESISLKDRRLLEMLGVEESSLNFKGENALKEATVFSCIRILADSVGKLPIKVYQIKEGRQVDVGHYLTPLLKTRPNPLMTSRDFFKALEVQRNLYGNAYAYLDFETRGRNAGKLKGVYPLDSSKVEIYCDDIGLVSNTLFYVYRDDKGKEYKINQDEMIHLKGLTTNGLIGMTPLEKLKSTVENAGASSE